jgi:hypothetical protein
MSASTPNDDCETRDGAEIPDNRGQSHQSKPHGGEPFYDQGAPLEFIGVTEFANLFNLSKNGVRKMIKTGAIPAIQLKKEYRIPNFWERLVPWNMTPKALDRWQQVHAFGPKIGFNPLDLFLFMGQLMMMKLKRSPDEVFHEYKPKVHECEADSDESHNIYFVMAAQMLLDAAKEMVEVGKLFQHTKFDVKRGEELTFKVRNFGYDPRESNVRKG